MAKGTTEISRRGKTTKIYRNAWDVPLGNQTTRTSEARDNGGGSRSTANKKRLAKTSTTGIGNPREGKYPSSTGRKTKYYTGGGF